MKVLLLFKKLPVKSCCTPQRSFFYFLLLASFACTPAIFSQTAPLTFTPISYSSPDIIAPGRGAEQWNNGDEKINNPTADTNRQSLDVYYRFPWVKLEGATSGSYNWTYFDNLVKDAIDHKQKFSFGIMPVYDNIGTVVYDQAKSAYPLYLHKLMQADSVNSRDWISNGVWIPNWNSPHYLGRLRALHEAVYKHIMATSYKGVAFRNVIYYIDIRGYGYYGEWHNAGIVDDIKKYPAGRRATVSTLKTIINHHTQVFGLWPLMIMAATFDAEQYDAIMNPVEIGHYALTTSNAWGPLGWRRDQWGANDTYLDAILKFNEKKFGTGPPLKDLITTRYRTAPVTGEPPRYVNPGGPCEFWDLERQMIDYGVTSMGNGNWGVKASDCGQENARAAFKRSGYRLIIEGGNISAVIKPGKAFSVLLNWKNIGIAPTYENWNAVYELKNDSNKIVWSATSKFNLKRFCPPTAPSTGATPFADTFLLPGIIPAGNYKLNLIIKDPVKYRDPLPLAITGRNSDGSYTIKNIVVSPVNCVPPVATINSTSTCKGRDFDLVLSSATGTGPYDLVINGISYPDIATGQTIGTFNPAVQKIWDINPTAISNQDSPVELGVKFRSSVTGLIKGIRFFSPNNASGVYTAHLWTKGGTLLDSATFTSVTAGSWQEVLFANPVPILADTVYIASYHTASGQYAATAGGLAEAVTNGSLTALDNDNAGGNGIYSYGPSGNFPSTNSPNGANYWVDVLFDADSYLFNLTSITDGNNCNNTGSLQTVIVTPTNCDTLPRAKIGYSSHCRGEAFNLSLDYATGPGPYDLVINNTTYNDVAVGQTIATFSPTVQKIWNNSPSTESHEDAPVELGVKFKSAKDGYIKGLRFFSSNNPSGVYTGHLWTNGGTLLDSATFINVTTSNWQDILFTTPVRILADSVYIASYHTSSGHYSGTAGGLINPVTNDLLTALDNVSSGGNGVYSYGASGSFPSTISSNAANYWVDVLFSPDTSHTHTFNLTSVTDSTGSTRTGALQTLTVTSTNNCNINLPTATISSSSSCDGQSFNLVLDSATGPAPYDLVINGTPYYNIDLGQTITTINGTSQKIWNNNPFTSDNKDAPVELGVKFKSSKAGFIKGIRFFSPGNPSGIYTGHLWTKGGVLLDSATFTNVNPGSWQEVLFTNSVRIVADSIYVASYHTASGQYSGTAGGLTNATTNGSLTALGSISAGGNGLYSYGASGSFPATVSSNAANYWVDVIFAPDSSYTYTFNLTGVTDSAGSTRSGALQTLIVTSTNNCDTPLPTAIISSSPSCNGQPAELVLDSATGPGPHDLVINGVTYTDVTPGETIAIFDPPMQKIWNTNPPLSSHQDAPVELGLKFKSSKAGFIKGIRFFSPGNPSGIYTGHLWTSAGTLLNGATFTNVKAGNWQEVLFTNPVEILADTIYIASYHTTTGRYSGTAGGLNKAVVNGSLTALDKNIAGGSSFYSYGGSGSFPSTISPNAANYWVDVLFVPDSSYTHTFNLTSVTDSTGSTKSGTLQTISVTSTECTQSRSTSTSEKTSSTQTLSSTFTHLKASPEVKNVYSLGQNSPNPFTNQTNIQYSVPAQVRVNISLFDVNGKLVKILVNELKDPGIYKVNLNSGLLSGGLYFYKMQTRDFLAVKKMIVQ